MAVTKSKSPLFFIRLENAKLDPVGRRETGSPDTREFTGQSRLDKRSVKSVRRTDKSMNWTKMT